LLLERAATERGRAVERCALGSLGPSHDLCPVEQSKGKEELAETGAAETTFLVIGAATMIAGGIGFRILPRLVGGGRTVA
ncbi:LPXTG cell wall anchor domain-containing protein, partial [Streptomyces griseus]|uniref:LPXTG cell wall anchor domain-containing protein n=1 Tax=Streptomyces griseus TaxID=1911 RepID=UPI0034006900